ncbi:alpha/beta hydrolase family protein [Pontixanthobacter aquaemixtae]|uniref:Alpha/beta fold hydrolase n=1 Tax=Pontixanthobacter aquaemixtae TaxID=1958940 RepID=A0A844ZQY1_9SPHN|nr:alpha/beta fold hydrolase [Pontixanthobacter aquaemixtae]MXO90158.1 alpha/beta fold hydrolase [Pontixanthobacter aquaemixtae]
MRKRLLTSFLLGGALVAPIAQAETLEETATVFGMREAILDISLSPSGNQIAYIAPAGHSTEAVFIVDLNGNAEPKPIIQFSEENAELTECDWATETRFVCEVAGILKDGSTPVSFSRLLAIGADGSEAKLLTQRTSSRALGFRQNGGDIIALDLEGEQDKILMTRQWIKEVSINTRLANEEEGLGVDEVDVVSGRRSKLERPDENAVAYIADEDGRVRMKVRQPDAVGGMLSDRRLFYFRKPDSRSWELLSRIEVDSQTYSGLYPVAINSAENIAYAFASHNGYEALYTIPLEEGGEPSLLLSREDADVDRLIRIGRDRRVVGASYATERRENAYIDTELKTLSDGLRQALPGKPLITIIGASSDENILMIVASSDTDPGMTYLYDKGSRRLEPLLPLRNHMDGRTLSEMKPVTFPASDGVEVPGYLTLPPGSDGKNLPTIVLPHGGPSSRDEWGFDWLVQFFAARGYAVLQPNYRGSSGYGSDWFGKNGFQAWQTAIGDVNGAGRWMVSQGIADPDKLAIVGWSYGGYAALQSQVLDASLYKAVVAIAPVTDLEQLRSESMRYTSGRLVDSFIGRGDHVRAGSPGRNIDAFKSPVLLVHGDLDLNVDVNQSRVMHDRLEDADKAVKYIEFENVAHSLDATKVRYEMLKEIDTFLSTNMAN